MSELGKSTVKFLERHKIGIIRDAQLLNKRVRWGGRWQHGDNTPAGTAIIYIDKVMVSLTSKEKPLPTEGAPGWALMIDLAHMRIQDLAWLTSSRYQMPMVRGDIAQNLAAALISRGVLEMQSKALRDPIPGMHQWKGIYHWRNDYSTGDLVAYDRGMFVATTGKGVPSHSDGWKCLDYIAHGSRQEYPSLCTTTVTVGNDGLIYGYRSAAFGSIDPVESPNTGMYTYEVSCDVDTDTLTMKFGEAGDQIVDVAVNLASIYVVDYGDVSVAWDDTDKCYYSFGNNDGLGQLFIDRLDDTICIEANHMYSNAFYAATYSRVDYESLPQGIGYGVPAFTHAEPIYSPDYEGVYREFGANDPVWRGSRRVNNFFRDTDNITEWFTFGSAAITSPSTATLSQAGDYVRGQFQYSYSYRYAEHPIVMRIKLSGNGSCRLVLANSTGATISDAELILDSTERVYTLHGVSTSAHTSGFVYIRKDAGHTITEVSIKNYQVETRSGCEETTIPGEYVPVPEGADRYDWIARYFSNLNGNTVLDNVVTEVEGDPLPVPPMLVAQKDLITNSCLWSRDLTQSAWSDAGTGIVRSYDQTGISGEPNTASYLEDDNGSLIQKVQHDVTITNDSNTNVVVFYVKKDADPTRFPLFDLRYRIGTLVTYSLRIDTLTGASHIVTDTGVGSVHEVTDTGDWWKLVMSFANNSTGNTGCRITINPADTTTFIGAAQTVATGSIVVGNVELHLNKTIDDVRDLGPIFTEDVPVSTGPLLPTYAAANHDNTEGAYAINLDWDGEYKDILTIDGNLLSVVEGGVGDEIIVNGTFDTDLSGWIDIHGNGSGSWVDGKLRIDTFVNYQNTIGQTPLLEIGKTYVAECDIDTTNLIAGYARFQVTTSGHFETIDVPLGRIERLSLVFTATGVQGYFYLSQAGVTVGNGYTLFDNCTFKEAAPVLQLTDGTNVTQIPISEGEHVAGVAYGDSKMDLNLDSRWAGEVDYDGEFGTGVIVQGETAREIMRHTANYTDSRDWVVLQTAKVTYHGQTLTYNGETITYTPTV